MGTEQNIVKNDNGLWIPEKDQFDLKRFEALQDPFIELIAGHCNSRQRAIDVGGHIGIWAKKLSPLFQEVVSFEPMPVTFECLSLNTKGYNNVRCIRQALGNTEKNINLEVKNPKNYGTTTVTPRNTPNKAHMVILDQYGYNDVSLIKIDVEGYELNVLKGARETIQKNQPIIFLEVNNLLTNHGTSKVEIFNWLNNMGMVCLEELRTDCLFGWENKKGKL